MKNRPEDGNTRILRSRGDILQLVKDWLEDDMSGKWLLIIDNADDSDVLYSPTTQSARLADHIPRSENGCISATNLPQSMVSSHNWQ